MTYSRRTSFVEVEKSHASLLSPVASAKLPNCWRVYDLQSGSDETHLMMTMRVYKSQVDTTNESHMRDQSRDEQQPHIVNSWFELDFKRLHFGFVVRTELWCVTFASDSSGNDVVNMSNGLVKFASHVIKYKDETR